VSTAEAFDAGLDSVEPGCDHLEAFDEEEPDNSENDQASEKKHHHVDEVGEDAAIHVNVSFWLG
jgi:hypothetical protein